MTATSAALWRHVEPGRRALLIALLASAVLHGTALYAAGRWGSCVCAFGKVVCPKTCGQYRTVNIQLANAPPPAPPKPRLKPQPAVVIEKPEPHRPLAAPKAGRIVLPDEALKPAPMPKADITLDRPAIPQDVVVSQSEAQAPVIATSEVFDRASDLIPGDPGEHGLGGTGKATGLGPFGSDKDGSGEGASGDHPPAPVTPAKAERPPPPPPKGPSRPPRVLNWTDPPYPEQARQQGVEATVVLRLTVGGDGTPRDVRVSKSSGHAALDDAAITHVRRARFTPALKDGEPVSMTMTFRVRFRLVNA